MKEERVKKRRQIGKVKKKKEQMDEVLTVYGGRRPTSHVLSGEVLVFRPA
jgi:hypothetical protein